MVCLFFGISLQVDPFTRLASGLTTSVLHGVPVVCSSNEYFRFQAPNGETCGAYAGAFATAVGAYIGNPQSTGECEYCSYSYVSSFEVFCHGPPASDQTGRWVHRFEKWLIECVCFALDPQGDSFYQNLTWSFDDRWANLGYFVVYPVSGDCVICIWLQNVRYNTASLHFTHHDILCCFQVFNIIVTIVAARFINWAKR